MPWDYTERSGLSPWVSTVDHPCKGMALGACRSAHGGSRSPHEMLGAYSAPVKNGPGGAGRSLQLDEALVRCRDDGLQLGVDLQLLDDVTDVPLDGVGGDGKAL